MKIEELRIKIRRGRAESVGHHINRLGKRVPTTEYRETYETPSGDYAPSEWIKLAEQAIVENELEELLMQVESHCRANCAWLKNNAEIHAYALECIAADAYRAWKDFEFIPRTRASNNESAFEPKPAVTKAYKVYGLNGHRQAMSFQESVRYDFSSPKDGVRILDIHNADITGTNEYTLIFITRNTEEECDAEIMGQVTDGYFENVRTGEVVDLGVKKYYDDYQE